MRKYAADNHGMFNLYNNNDNRRAMIDRSDVTLIQWNNYLGIIEFLFHITASIWHQITK